MSDWTSRDDGNGLGLLTAMEQRGLALTEVWWHYIAIGGRHGLPTFADEVAGIAPPGDEEHDLIAHAINESLLDHGVSSFPVEYASTLRVESARDRAPRVTTDRDPAVTGPTSARERAAVARQRSATASRQAAVLQLNAARLLSASGRMRFASHAMERSELAQARFRASQVSG